MTPEAGTTATGPERRRRRSEERLREALRRLIAGTAPGHGGLTVAALCRAAGVGRNAVYANHRFALDELARARRAAAGEAAVGRDRMAELRAEVDDLKLDKARLATENAGLLVRALDAEAAAAGLRRQVEALQQALQRFRDGPVPERPSGAGARRG